MTAIQTRRTLVFLLAVCGPLVQRAASQDFATGKAPDLEAVHLRPASGFRIELVRHMARLARPVALGFDAQGRAWVASRASPDKGGGELVVIGTGEEPDGVFAAELVGLSAFAFHRDGVIAGVETGLLRLRDRDADDRADERVTLFSGLEGSGWVIGDLVWGIDGWIYGTLGAAPGRAEEPWRVLARAEGDETELEVARLTGGLFRLRPDGSAIEQVIALDGGASSLDVTWDGELFFSAPGLRAAHVVLFDRDFRAGRVHDVASWSALVNQSSDSGGSEFVGATVYGGGAWPDEYANSLFVADASGGLVRREPFHPSGLSFQVRKRPATEFLASPGGGFHPVALAVGPDAALYVLDGSDAGGRLWRMLHASQQKEQGALASRETPELFGELEYPNLWRRLRAHRFLEERSLSKEDRRALAVRARNSTEPWVKIHALWLGAGGSELLSWALGDYYPSVRRNALRAAASHGSGSNGSVSMGARVPEPSVMALVRDADARVRLAALSAWSSVVSSVHLSRLALHYPKLDEDWSRSVALTIAARHPVQFLRTLFRDGREGVYVEFVRRMTDSIARTGAGGDAVGLLLELNEGDRSPRLVAAVLDGLVQGTVDSEGPWPSPRLARVLRRLAGSDDERIALAALPLAERWAADQIATSDIAGWVRAATRILDDPERSLELRLAGVRTLLAMQAGREAGLARAALLLDALERGVVERVQLTKKETALLLGHSDAKLASRARSLLE